MIARQLLSMLLSMFLTNGLGVVIYCGLFSYSFRRRKYFLPRLIISLLIVAGITSGIAFGVYFGFTGGWEVTLAHVELIRIVSNVLSLLLAMGAIWFCFDEKFPLIMFATVMGNAGNCLAQNIYEMFLGIFKTNSIHFTMYNGYSVLRYVLFFGIHTVIFFLLLFVCAKPLANTTKDFDKNIGKSIFGAFVIFTYIMTGVQGSNVFNAAFNGATMDAVSIMFHSVLAVLYIMILFTLRFILVWVHTSQEKAAEKNFYDSYKEKVELQERNMELINLKCHDMKHQLRTLLEGKNMDNEFIEETQKAISVFDAQVQTGNNTLDTLLTQKSLICEAQRIELTVMIDGGALQFMSVQDINSFFGNAIDNAVEHLMTVPEEYRFIRISSLQNGSIFSVRIENYCDTELNFRRNGLPESTKEDNGYHGFGTKSIRAIAQKYGGDASFERKDNLFIVTAIFML